MEVRLDHQVKAKCHPQDIWEIFQHIEDWHKWSGIYGQAGWVFGKPWQQGSRFIVELLYPKKVDLEVVVLRCKSPHQIVLLSHGDGIAAEQWLSFMPASEHDSFIRSEQAFVGPSRLDLPALREKLNKINERLFDGLKAEAEKHCSLIAL